MVGRTTSESVECPKVKTLVPYAHVASIERSIEFYQHLGFTVDSSHAAPDGRPVWALLECGDAKLMLAAASGPIAAVEQAVLFYLYADRVESIRRHLLSRGVRDGGTFVGSGDAVSAKATAYEVSRPFYMPHGELRVHDPDGFVLLIGQLEDEASSSPSNTR